MAEKTIFVITGGLLTRGKDWSHLELRELYHRLTRELIRADEVNHYIKYHGNRENQTIIRFFGVRLKSIDTIPPGMVTFRLSEDDFSVYKQGSTGPVLVWRSRLFWNRNEFSNPIFPSSEFTTLVPESWGTKTGNQKITFKVSGIAHIEQQKRDRDDEDSSLPDESRSRLSLISRHFSKKI